MTARRPLVLEIHGGPHTLYGWAPVWEFQILAAAGIGVFACNPRGSEGYGQAFSDANHRDWGPGPMRDVLAGVDALVADGLADPDRLGVTGGSYGGYLTNWIVGHDRRFRTAMTCRSVSDMGVLFTTGDISGGEWARLEFDATPWDDPAYFREISPLAYADRIRTPLLIQHAERDIRTTVAQAEALFTVLRSHRRPVRLLRVPEETHELTRSGTPFRRVENLRIVEGWFRHFLIEGKRGLPPLPKVRGGGSSVSWRAADLVPPGPRCRGRMLLPAASLRRWAAISSRCGPSARAAPWLIVERGSTHDPRRRSGCGCPVSARYPAFGWWEHHIRSQGSRGRAAWRPSARWPGCRGAGDRAPDARAAGRLGGRVPHRDPDRTRCILSVP